MIGLGGFSCHVGGKRGGEGDKEEMEEGEGERGKGKGGISKLLLAG